MEKTHSSEEDEQTDIENIALHISTDYSRAENESLQQNSSFSDSWSGEECIINNPYLWPVRKYKIQRKKSLS